jgi:hypothetical protein
VLDYHGVPDDGDYDLRGATSPDELAEWLRATGLYQSVRNETSIHSTFPLSHAKRQYVVPKADTILFVHSSILPCGGKKPGIFDWANHFLLLRSPLVEGRDGQGRDIVEFDFWSWGSNIIHCNEAPPCGPGTACPTKEQFEDNYYGAIQALTR